MASVSSERAIYVDGITDLQRGLRAVDAKWPRELRKIHKEIGEIAAAEARDRAGRGDRGVGAIPSSRARASIRGMGEQRGAKVAWGKASVPWAAGQIMGSIQYPQFPGWVGNTWPVGVSTDGPYYINPAIDEKRDEMMEMLHDRLADLTSRVDGFRAA